MLASEIIYNIKNLIAGGIQSDDESISNRQLMFIIDYYRARLLKQDQEKGRFMQSLYVQNLGCVGVSQQDKNNEKCATDEAEDCILRTTLKLPKPLESHTGINITFVGNSNGKPFQHKSHNAMHWKSAAKWTGKEPAWYFQSGYVYLIDPPTKMFSNMNVQGIFESPQKAQEFRTCDCPENNEPCLTGFDFEYPLPLHHVDTIVKLIAQTELSVLSAIPVDNSNNSVDQLTELLSAGGK
tara:strand:+ start:121 stop:837 length:717 start_codon:yes stop_codon:yes gene_type:complete